MQEAGISVLVVVRDEAKFLLLSHPPRTCSAHMAANDELGVCCRAREWGHSESEITNTKEGDFLARKKRSGALLTYERARGALTYGITAAAGRLSLLLLKGGRGDDAAASLYVPALYGLFCV